MGETTSRPSPSWCMESVLGADVDLIIWDYEAAERGGRAANLELFVRQALALPSRPALLWRAGEITPKQRSLLKRYAGSAETIMYMVGKEYESGGAFCRCLSVFCRSLRRPLLHPHPSRLPSGLPRPQQGVRAGHDGARPDRP